MSPELQAKLFEDFPQLFEERNNRMSPMAFGCEVGDGWHGIIRSMCLCLKGEGVRFSQIKEKYGTLRAYFTGGGDRAEGVVEMAEQLSAFTCEACGRPGTCNGSGWLMTRCPECRAIATS